MTNPLDLYVNANKEVRILNLPNEETINALTVSVMRLVALDLQNNNIKGALDTKDKLQAMEDYIAAKVSQQEADLKTQNMIAALRLRTIREIGDWCEKNIEHSGGKPSPEGKVTWKKIGVSHNTGNEWMAVSKIPNDQFELWLTPYLGVGVKTGMELYFSRLLEFAEPRITKAKEEKEPDTFLLPSVMAVQKATSAWKESIRIIVQEIGKRKIPHNQILFLYEEIKDMPKIINSAIEI